MACCFGSDTNGQEPQKSISEPSDPPPKKPIIPVSRPSNPKIEYSITVKTGDFRNSGTNGPVYITIFNRDGKQTEDVLLTAHDKAFSQGSTRKFQVNATDIGKPQRVIIRHEDKSTGWYVDYVEVSVHNFLVRFVANRWLNQLKNDRKLEMELFGSEQPAVSYEIEVQTGDQQVDVLDSPVYMQVYGSTTRTPKFFLEARNVSIKPNSTSKFSISSNNVGEIERIVIGHEGLGEVKDWHLRSVKVQMLSQQHEYVVDKWLSTTQGDQRLFVELSKDQPRSPSPPPPVEATPPPKYIVTIHTGDTSPTETTDSIEMIIRGTEGQIPKMLLKDLNQLNGKPLFQRGASDEFEIERADIGQIESITIGFSDSEQTAAWLLERVHIQYQETIYCFEPHCWLSNRLGPDFSWITIKPHDSNDDIGYKVTVVTGESGVDANVILCIFGEKDATKNLPLRTTKDGSPAKFENDSTLEFDVKAIDVGKITKINIGHDGKDEGQRWFLKSIQIEKNDEQYMFQVNRWLSEGTEDEQKAYADLFPSDPKPPSPVAKTDQATYEITIVTSSTNDAGTDSKVFMTIFGDKDDTKQFQLAHTKQGDRALFEAGKSNDFELQLDDVGTINKIRIALDGNGLDPKWHLESVQIQKGSDKYNFIAKKVFNQSAPSIELTPASTNATPSPEPTPLKSSRSVTPDQRSTPVKETTYKVCTRTGSEQMESVKENPHFYIVIHGQNGETEKLYFTNESVSTEAFIIQKDEKNEFQFKSTDVGKIAKIVIGQDDSDSPVVWNVDHVLVTRNNETITFNAEQTVGHHAEIELHPSAIAKKTETTYRVLIQTGAYHQDGSDSNIYLTIYGRNGQTKRLPLNKTSSAGRQNSFKSDDQIEFALKANDVGKISKVILSQNADEHGVHWHIDRLTIKQNSDTTTFHVKRKIDKSAEIELVPSLLARPSSKSPRKAVKISDPVSKVAVRMKDADYVITTVTGEQATEVPISMKVRGEHGTVAIPLSQTKGGEKPFKAKATNEFTCRTTDVGKIQNITVEHNDKDGDVLWHLKTVQIKKGGETYNFNADVRLDRNDNKVNLYPAGALYTHPRDDYVQSELRRLRENLRCESSKLRRPAHQAHQPFVFNDLRPYFDTSSVEKAIYSPVNVPSRYYTRVTALRIVEPWESHGMDYGVNYELFKHRKTRSLSAKPLPPKPNESVDRKQGSTHLPTYPLVDMRKPAEYSGPLTMNDVPKIRTLIQTRYGSQADNQMQKDYKRTHDDVYRMQLDNLDAYHESNRENMLRVYRSYLENKPGSKKALRELCGQISPRNTKSDVKTNA